MQDEVRILVADDHGIVRMGLIQEIKQLKPRAQLYEVEDYDALYKLVAKEKFDLAILDVKMPNGSLQEAIEYIRFKQPELRILVFSSQDEQLYAARYLKMGADGFLNKHSSREVIERALNDMLSKGKYLSEELRDAMIFDSLTNQKKSSPVESLSNRELQVANKLCEGMTIKEMSDHLHLHTSTISTYKNRIFEKLNIN
ncbi:MAG TPA: response regulator transcription factor, partial [Membranihabitans sp.]|nr:response regulator transcription factor [Membranihabitans sp.]